MPHTEQQHLEKKKAEGMLLRKLEGGDLQQSSMVLLSAHAPSSKYVNSFKMLFLRMGVHAHTEHNIVGLATYFHSAAYFERQEFGFF